jgi:hypothetical protein
MEDRRRAVVSDGTIFDIHRRAVLSDESNITAGLYCPMEAQITVAIETCLKPAESVLHH